MTLFGLDRVEAVAKDGGGRHRDIVVVAGGYGGGHSVVGATPENSFASQFWCLRVSLKDTVFVYFSVILSARLFVRVCVSE